MPQLKNDRFLKAIRQEPVDMTPIWVMRQAGRYLPEYRATRAKAGSFMQLCRTPELACEVTLQPIDRYPLDASIIFSDILTIPEAMGLGLDFVEGKGPVFAKTIRDSHAVSRLTVPAPESLDYVYEAIKLTQHELDGRVPLIGFCGSPWTLAAYMVQGESQPGFPMIMKMLQEDPFLLHSLLDVLAQSVYAHLKGQIEAGVQAVMLFDSWGGILSDENYQEFSLYYVKQILKELRQSPPKNRYNEDVPFILFTKGGSRWLEQMVDTGCDVLGVDWTVGLDECRQRVQGKVALQGNLDPAIMLQSPEMIRDAVAKTLAAYGKGSGHIFNLGHGITPDVPPEHMSVLVEAVHELSQPYHQ